MKLDARKFIDDVLTPHIQSELEKSVKRQTFEITALATVDPEYLTGLPRVQWEGSEVVSLKAYPYASAYTPVAGDRVIMLRMGKTWIVLDKLVET